MHPGVNRHGCEGTISVEQESGHEKSANIALVLTATYTDNGAAGSQPLEGFADAQAQPEGGPGRALRRPERHGASTTRRPRAAGASALDPGDSFYFEPFSLKGVNRVAVRYASTGAGGLPSSGWTRRPGRWSARPT